MTLWAHFHSEKTRYSCPRPDYRKAGHLFFGYSQNRKPCIISEREKSVMEYGIENICRTSHYNHALFRHHNGCLLRHNHLFYTPFIARFIANEQPI